MSSFMPYSKDSNNTLTLLKSVRKFKKQKELADLLDVSVRQVRRWETSQCKLPSVYSIILRDILYNSTNSNGGHEFAFIDLFAGIGGMRMAFESVGGKCVYTSEYNSFSETTYRANFATSHRFDGDITLVTDKSAIPDHDVLVAGFPCQPFSIAGVSKKNSLGREHGFKDRTQGTLFFDIAEILEAKRPKAFLLENVKNLVSHDGGNTLRVILNTLEELGYVLGSGNDCYKIIDARHFVPQHRERTFIVGFQKQTGFNWIDYKLPDFNNPILEQILHLENGSEEPEYPYTCGKMGKVADKYTLSDHLWTYLQNYAQRHKARGNGFGFGLVGKKDVARTLSARYFKDGSEILINQGKRRNPRRLTPRECARLMGFDSTDRNFTIPVSDTQAYKQFGNAVVVPVVHEIARIMKPHLLALMYGETSQRYLPLSA